MKPEEVPDYNEELSQEEEQELLDYISSGNYPKMQEKQSLLALFNRVFKAKDTSKASFLNERELEAIRILQSTAEYAKRYDLDEVAEYIKDKAEIILSSALSREGFFLQTAVTSKKQLTTESKFKGGKKSWLGKKQD